MIRVLYQALRDSLPPGTPLYLGTEALDQNGVPPRLVLVPEQERFTPPGPPFYLDADGDRPFAVREVGFSLYLWGAGWDETEAMLHEALSLARALPLPLSWEGGEWIEGGQLALGVAYRLRGVYRVGVGMRARYGTLEAIAQQCAGLM
ncbi:hypothetical protein KQ693_05870 [Thermus sp. PS18]|uniref:hypothetical protein n=1 Tax=Thermus sp. PS18 TaxID=2849039 RepID=UPI0022640BEF|nr:hypothetical protein [Thermus sp. PS18]UZX16556.1 hypothetical protein KQ693_05870 [Thermus sp. PS18]